VLFSDPQWGKGCLTLIVGVAGVTLLRALFGHVSLPDTPLVQGAGSLIILLIFLGIVRFILNQIFDL
jgi:hypothetical protein